MLIKFQATRLFLMKILTFDTSNSTISVAICEGKTLLACQEELRPSMQAERLVPMIAEILASCQLSYQQIDYLGVINGPGSFTGVRIGLAAAQGIVLATNIIGAAVTNFELIHYRARQQVCSYDKIMVIIDAYRRQLYCQIFDQAGNSTTPLLVDYHSVIAWLKRQTGQIICAGSGAAVIYQQIKHCCHINILPRLSRVKALYIGRYLYGQIITKMPLKALSPLYIRPPDAKIPKIS